MFSKMIAESKDSILKMFADSVKNIPPAQETTYQCKAFYNSAKSRVAPSTAESYMFTVRSSTGALRRICATGIRRSICSSIELTVRGGLALSIWSWRIV